MQLIKIKKIALIGTFKGIFFSNLGVGPLHSEIHCSFN